MSSSTITPGAGQGGERHLAEVEAHGTRGVEQLVIVVHGVEAPQERQLVVGAVPPVDPQVEQQDVDDEPSGPARKAGRRPEREPVGPGGERQHQQRREQQVEPEQAEIAPEPAPRGRGRAAGSRTSSGLATAGRSRSHSAKIRADRATSAVLRPTRAATSIQGLDLAKISARPPSCAHAGRFPNTGSGSGGRDRPRYGHPLCSARASDGQSTRSLTWRTCDA